MLSRVGGGVKDVSGTGFGARGRCGAHGPNDKVEGRIREPREAAEVAYRDPDIPVAPGPYGTGAEGTGGTGP